MTSAWVAMEALLFHNGDDRCGHVTLRLHDLMVAVSTRDEDEMAVALEEARVSVEQCMITCANHWNWQDLNEWYADQLAQELGEP